MFFDVCVDSRKKTIFDVCVDNRKKELYPNETSLQVGGPKRTVEHGAVRVAQLGRSESSTLLVLFQGVGILTCNNIHSIK